MKAQIKVGPKLIVEVEGATHTDLFKELAQAQEVFEHEQCGKCKNGDVRFVVREVDKNLYFELHCRNPHCRARLPFGQAKEPNKGQLYPKRKFGSLGKNEQKQRASEKDYAEKHYGYLADNGWHKWEKDAEPE